MARLAFTMLCLAAVTVPAGAQTRLEIVAAGTLPVGEARGTFQTDYEPVLINGGTAVGGAGGQTLRLEGERTAGFQVGVNWLVSRRAGIQVLVDRMSHAIGGANASNRIQLTYLARQPPDFVERTYTYDQSVEWPATQGSLTQWRVGANALWRMSGRRADLTLTGGALVSRVTGYFDEASYIEFRLGGHSTIFYEEARARLRFDEGWRVGVNAGAELAIPVGRRVALTAGVRLTSSPSALRVTTEILNADQMIFEIPIERVEENLATHPARFTRWPSPMVTVGLRFR